MRCSTVRKRLNNYIDGRLDQSEAEAMSRHIGMCDACAREAGAASRVDDLLDAWETVEPRLGFDALVARIDQRSESAKSRRLGIWPVIPKWATGAALVGVLAGTITGAVTSDKSSSPVPDREVVASAIGLEHFDDTIEASILDSARVSTSSEGGVSK